MRMSLRDHQVAWLAKGSILSLEKIVAALESVRFHPSTDTTLARARREAVAALENHREILRMAEYFVARSKEDAAKREAPAVATASGKKCSPFPSEARSIEEKIR